MTAHDILLQLTLFCCFFIPETLTVGCGTYEEEITVPYERFDFRPFAGKDYQNNLQCRWTFYTPNNFSITFVQFTVFHLQSWWPCSDYVMVSLHNTSSGNVLNEWGPMCGNDKPSDTSIHPGEKLVITFRSGRYMTETGFEFVAFSTVLKECDEAICPTIQVSYAQGTSFSSFTGFYNYTGEINGRLSYTQQHGGATIRYTQIVGVVDMKWALVDSASYIQAYSDDIKYQCPYGIPKISWFLWNSNGHEKVDIASDWNISCNSRCTPLRTPNNAELVFRGDDTVGSSTVFRCLDNNTMLGDSRRVCLQNSTWTGKKLECKADCVQPENGNNSQIRKNSSRYLEEDVVLYDCHIGFFYYSGHRQMVCQPNGTWSGKPLHCTEASKEAKSMKADIQTAAIASTMGVLVVIGIIIAVFLIRRRLVLNPVDKHSDAKFTNSQHPSGAAFEQSNEICLEQMHATESGNTATTEMPTPSQNQDGSPSQNIDDSYAKVNKPARQDQDSFRDRYDALYELENPTVKAGENEYCSIIESDTTTAQQKQTNTDPSNVVMVENDIYDRGVDDDYTLSPTLVENDLYNA